MKKSSKSKIWRHLKTWLIGVFMGGILGYLLRAVWLGGNIERGYAQLLGFGGALLGAFLGTILGPMIAIVFRNSDSGETDQQE